MLGDNNSRETKLTTIYSPILGIIGGLGPYKRKTVIIAVVVIVLVLILIIGLGAGLGTKGKGGGGSRGRGGGGRGGRGGGGGDDGQQGGPEYVFPSVSYELEA